jgi:hypothetical protein
MRIRVGVFIVSALTIWVATVPAAKAAETETAGLEVADRVVLHLDSGFVGRPVSLDLFGGTVRVSWDAGDLTAPTMLMVERIPMASSTEGDIAFGQDAVRLTWADPYLLSGHGVRIEIPGACIQDAWTDCAAYRSDGSSWTKLADGRVAGYALVRVGSVKAAYMKAGSASWYKFKNCRCAASPDFPKGTHVRVTSQLTGKTAVVRINDWGPERDKFPDRVIDLDAVAFKDFAPLGAGVIHVSVEPLTPDDPDYALADVPLPKTAVVAVAKPAPTVPVDPPVWSY